MAIVCQRAPDEEHETVLEDFFHAGTLDYASAQLGELIELRSRIPTVLEVFMDRPAILSPFADKAAAITAISGAGNPSPA
ncbi:hypothetical protein [Paeniglutamicibacter cryotolerans]|uniref:Uncharacterized protein n=1 Tax=Paeniglutamicibacter cryotolerans TaxID=670079 RepID=A0A839QGU6_9MICC|nr:hypothetical protein [Paeniglutamicibacter cryotolerans]MBB2995120.1 hypothetical protein [Paeniglutamicibacter cryotolerans]